MIKYSIIIPVYKDINIAKNAVLSSARQWKPTDENKPHDWKLEVVIVNDSPDVDMSSLVDTFNENKLYKDYECKYYTMPSNQGEGNARKLGIYKSTGEYFFLMDMDDVFGPNVVNRCNEIIIQNKGKQISMIEFPFTNFDFGYVGKIEAYSIWVQSKLYNKKFIMEHEIYSTDLSSRAGADYNFITKLHGVADYYDRVFKETKNSEWTRIVCNPETSYTWSYWFPSESQTRKCSYWGDWICPITVLNGLDAVNYLRTFEENHNENRREFWKHDIMNKACYNFINLHSVLRSFTVNEEFQKRVTNIDPISNEDNNVVFYKLFKDAFLGTSKMAREYIDEIWDIDINCIFAGVWERSDVHKCQTWIDFRDYIKNAENFEIFNFENCEQLIEYCKKNYSFDQNGYPLHAEQYKTFIKALEQLKSKE